MPAMRSSLAISTSWRTAAITLAEVLVRCPRRRLGRRISVWTPPTQWMSRMLSAASVSISAITSWITVRTMRFFSRASVVGAVQTLLRSAARGERCRIDVGRDRGGVMGGNLGFDLRLAGERLVPSRLQFASHQSVCRVGSVVLPEGAIGCIARRFEITPERLTHLVPLLPRLLLGSNGRRNSARANDSEKGTLNGVIHPQPAKSDATRLAIVHPAAGAAVARDVMLRSRVAEGQFTPASATAEQAR